jgi:hypothetical protein
MIPYQEAAATATAPTFSITPICAVAPPARPTPRQARKASGMQAPAAAAMVSARRWSGVPAARARPTRCAQVSAETGPIASTKTRKMLPPGTPIGLGTAVLVPTFTSEGENRA